MTHKVIITEEMVGDCVDPTWLTRQLARVPAKAPITPEVFGKQMSDFAQLRDVEKSHVLADALMCTVLAQLGYRDGVDVFVQMLKWYE